LNGSKIIIATTALGCGIDIPDIRLVLFAGVPFTLTEFVQGSGRAGRDGSTSYAIVVRNMRCFLNNDHLTNGVAEFLGPATCRRCVLEKYMDGNLDSPGCRNNEATCDFCSIPPIDEDPQRQTVTPSDEVAASLPQFYNTMPMHIQRPVPVSVPYRNPYKKARAVAQQHNSGFVPAISIPRPSIVGVMAALAPSAPSTNVTPMTNSRPSVARTTPVLAPSGFVPALVSTPMAMHASDSVAREVGIRNQARQGQNDRVSLNVSMEKWLRYFANPEPNSCLVCKVLHSHACERNHGAQRRDAERQRKGIGSFVASNRNARQGDDRAMPNFVICFQRGCYVHQDICLCFFGGTCQYRDILLDVVFIILLHNPLAATMVYDAVDMKDFMYRLLTRYASCGNQNILLHEIFVQLCETYVRCGEF
jgi:hypothetical protein